MGDGMSININDRIIEEIKTKNDIIDTISRYVQLKKSGQNHMGLCPFHKEKTPSFSVLEEKQFYHCFGCGETGDVIKFIMKIENVDFVEATTLLGERVGIRIEENVESKKEKEELSRKNRICELNREAAMFYHSNLYGGQSKGLAYFEKRGLKPDTIKKFGLGFADDSWDDLIKYLSLKGYEMEIIKEAGLIVKKKESHGYYNRFRNRIMFPIISAAGKVIGFGGRTIDDSLPKYLNTPESPVFSKGNNLFGINLAKKELGNEKRIIIVEGYMDVISLYQNDIKNVVASLGTALTKNQGRLLRKYADEVFLAYDTDSAGQTATLRGMDVLNEEGCQVKVIHLSDGKDPDELVSKKGKSAFIKEMDNAYSFIDYKIFLSKKDNDLSTVEGKIKFVKSITEVLKTIKSPVVADAYINKISLDTDISANAIKTEIYGNDKRGFLDNQIPLNTGKYRSKYDRNTNKDGIQPVSVVLKSGYLEAERCLLKLLILDRELFVKNKSMINFNDFSEKTHQKIAEILYSLYEEENFIDEDLILSKLDKNGIQNYCKIIESVIPDENHDKAIIDYIKNIKKGRIEVEKREIEIELKKIEGKENRLPENIVRIRELCINYEKIMKSLKNL